MLTLAIVGGVTGTVALIATVAGILWFCMLHRKSKLNKNSETDSPEPYAQDTGQDPKTKLEFKQRLSIALGAAKGLCHLHCLRRPLVHGNFKTTNVLVDENFIAKVADAGVSKLLDRIGDPGPRRGNAKIFRDPENNFVDRSLVGSFTADGMHDILRLMLQCLSFPRKRPKMDIVVTELDRILENEMAVTTGADENTATTVTLGSELFTS
ncbi:hypothetical protein Nepgr_010173 [Nepenthes gracilis]|uniref:non-specific serine/threonine protein kinase n=1 Tax=Nepenthes gracilis TaxID=150966 RepID=A0AAD3SC00_NEPGR|nr:hypothetical protein Nepgr_010173 [Nepenthes gracilis]